MWFPVESYRAKGGLEIKQQTPRQTCSTSIRGPADRPCPFECGAATCTTTGHKGFSFSSLLISAMKSAVSVGCNWNNPHCFLLTQHSVQTVSIVSMEVLLQSLFVSIYQRQRHTVHTQLSSGWHLLMNSSEMCGKCTILTHVNRLICSE